jgi:hypothetical protein
MRFIGLLGAAAFAVVACGGATDPLNGGSGGSTTVTGTVGGTPPATTDTVGLSGTHTQSGSTIAYAGVAITNVPGTCAVLQRHGDPPNTSYLTILVAQPGTSIPLGTYAVTGTNSGTVQAQYGTNGPTCQPIVSKTATSGSITFSTMTGIELTGTFDLTFGPGDHLTGSFQAPVCSYDLFANTTPSTCGS